MTLITIETTPSSGYRDRTLINAARAGHTWAFAFDFGTAGERLTLAASGGGSGYTDFDLHNVTGDWYDRARESIARSQIKRLNIAGNSEAALYANGRDQAWIDAVVFDVLSYAVGKSHRLLEVISGMQTGADLAGARAAYRLGIPFYSMMPAGYKQRDYRGFDLRHSADEIIEQITQSK